MSEYVHIVEIIIFINVFFIINVFALYPLILSISAKFFSKPLRTNENYQPTVTIIIAAYNEEKLIRGAIESIYNSDYPTEKLSVIVGSDGSSDHTVEIVQELKKTFKTLECYEFNRIGKNQVLNLLVPKAKTEIIFYMDADLRVEHETLKKMIKILSDTDVGAVLSSIKITSENSEDSSGSIGESIYQRYEKILRINESKLLSNINSLGTLYGIKMDVYNPIPNDLVCDDLYRLLQTAINRKRIIFDKDSVVIEVREKSIREELTRRIRLVGGGLSTISACRSILNPRYGWAAFFVWNHKILRWFSPIYLMIIAMGTALLINTASPLFFSLLVLQIILYFGAFLGWILERQKTSFLPLKLFLFIVSMNIGFFLGILRYIKKGQNSVWSRGVDN